VADPEEDIPRGVDRVVTRATRGCGGTISWPKIREERRMFAAIRYYRTDPDSIESVVRRVKEGFVPLIRETPGFVSYFVLTPRQGEIVSVSVFEQQQGAEESNAMAEDWVRRNVSELLPSPEVADGLVVVYEARY
jgi:Antibiotic biosynthesis monooxygenase